MPDPTRAMIGGLQFRYLIGRVPLSSEDGTVSQHPGLDGQVYCNTGRRGGVQQLTGRAAFETAEARALFIIACSSLRRSIVTLHDNDGLEWIGLFVVAVEHEQKNVLMDPEGLNYYVDIHWTLQSTM